MLSWQAWKDRSAVPLASVARVFAITGREIPRAKSCYRRQRSRTASCLRGPSQRSCRQPRFAAPATNPHAVLATAAPNLTTNSSTCCRVRKLQTHSIISCAPSTSQPCHHHAQKPGRRHKLIGSDAGDRDFGHALTSSLAALLPDSCQ
jgi:hypothetical protein